jgi:hypothetical protein
MSHVVGRASSAENKTKRVVIPNRFSGESAVLRVGC